MKAAFLLVALLLSTFAATARAEDGHVIGVDRSTPRRAMASYLEAAEAGDYTRASEVLDLRLVPPGERPQRGAELAEMLHRVLSRSIWIDPSVLFDDPNGSPVDGVDTERVGTVKVDRSEVPITLSRGETGDRAWSISAATVSRIPRMHEEHGPEWIETRSPRSLKVKVGGLALFQWLALVVGVGLSYVFGRFVTFLLFKIFERVTEKTRATWDDQLVLALRAPSRFLIGVLGFRVLIDTFALSAAASQVLARILGIVLITAVAWAIVRVMSVLAVVLEEHAAKVAREAAQSDEARESAVALAADMRVRGVATQVRVLLRVIHVAVGIVAVALMLMQFDVVRNVGLSLLASAGLAGVVLGFAAQRTFGSLVAGIQLSATQPIRIGDVVVIEKEQGTIEEITLTYVVVKIWDERRLIVPMTRILEQPFENWTKSSAELHGTVIVNVDWSIPIDELRGEVDKILAAHPDWDRRTKKMQIYDAKERAMTRETERLCRAAGASKRGFRRRPAGQKKKTIAVKNGGKNARGLQGRPPRARRKS